MGLIHKGKKCTETFDTCPVPDPVGIKISPTTCNKGVGLDKNDENGVHKHTMSMNSKHKEVICTSEPVGLRQSKKDENDIIKCEETKDFKEKLNEKPNPKRGWWILQMLFSRLNFNKK